MRLVHSNIREKHYGLDSKGCPICHFDKSMLRHVTEADGFTILKCLSCGLQFVANCRDIDKERLDEFYSKTYFEDDDGGFYESYWEDEKIHRSLAVFLLRKLRLLLSCDMGKLSLLDVGCAYGFLLDEARKLGMQTTGIEVSNYARAIAANKFGLAVYKNWEAMSEMEGRFDIITVLGVLEHLADPEEHIKLARHHLKPGGLFICTTLQVDFLFRCTYKPPEHLYYFSSRSLHILFARNGFEFLSKRRFLGFFSMGRFVTLFSNTFHIRNRLLTLLKARFGRIPIRAPSNEVLIVARKS